MDCEFDLDKRKLATSLKDICTQVILGLLAR
jgi:hypothetical protein